MALVRGIWYLWAELFADSRIGYFDQLIARFGGKELVTQHCSWRFLPDSSFNEYLSGLVIFNRGEIKNTIVTKIVGLRVEVLMHLRIMRLRKIEWRWVHQNGIWIFCMRYFFGRHRAIGFGISNLTHFWVDLIGLCWRAAIILELDTSSPQVVNKQWLEIAGKAMKEREQWTESQIGLQCQTTVILPIWQRKMCSFTFFSNWKEPNKCCDQNLCCVTSDKSS